MKIFEGFIFLAAATAIYITSTAAVPVDNKPKILFEDDSESGFTILDLPVVRYFTRGIPKYIQDIKEIIGSTNPMETAFSKIGEFLPKDVYDVTDYLDNTKNTDNSEKSLNLKELDKPLLVAIPVQVDVPEYVISTDFVNVPTEKSIIMGLDGSQPYEEILDWALEKLGYTDTKNDKESQIIDPILNNENDPDFRINYNGDANTIDDVEEKPVLSNDNPHSQINVLENSEYETNDPQWL